MYYTGLGRTISTAYGYILSAVSMDGLNWSKEPGIRFDVLRPNANYRVLCPDVILLPDDDRYRMFFEAEDQEGSRRILSATSA